jgi:hypothetical protein
MTASLVDVAGTGMAVDGTGIDMVARVGVAGVEAGIGNAGLVAASGILTEHGRVNGAGGMNMRVKRIRLWRRTCKRRRVKKGCWRIARKQPDRVVKCGKMWQGRNMNGYGTARASIETLQDKANRPHLDGYSSAM